MSFPTSPSNGQFAVINGINYQYSSADNAWKRVPAGFDTLGANNITVAANTTTGNIIAGGFYFANGTPFTSSNFGNADVAAYLASYYIYANANAATQATGIDLINANVGAYQVYANANAATQATGIDLINANVGAYQIWANASAYGNANVAAYLPTYTGNVRAGNVITSGFYWANGTPVSFSTGGGGGSAITVKDEGTTITSGATSFNFVGSGVSATNIGTDVTVTITGGGGGSFAYTAAATPPASGNVTGDQWFSTTSNVLYEYLYDGTSYFWVDINTTLSATSTGYVSRKYTTDGVTAGYFVSTGCTIFNVLVFLNGIAQTPTDDFTISGTTLTFVDIPAAGQILQIRELPR